MVTKKQKIAKILKANAEKKAFIPKKKGGSYTDKFVSVMLDFKEPKGKPDIIEGMMAMCDVDTNNVDAVLDLQRKVKIQLNIIVSNSKATTVPLGNNPIYKDYFDLVVSGKGMMAKYSLIEK